MSKENQELENQEPLTDQGRSLNQEDLEDADIPLGVPFVNGSMPFQPPTRKWLDKYKKAMDKLKPTSRVVSYFSEPEIGGLEMNVVDMGTLRFPTGWVVLADPLFWLSRNEPSLCLRVPMGEFPFSAAAVKTGKDDYRFAAVRVLFSDAPVVRCAEALRGTEILSDMGEGEIFGFRVESGWLTLMDIAARDAFCDLLENWEKRNPTGSFYDDYIAVELCRTCKEYPDYQEDGGSWINLPIFGRDLSFTMFRCGFAPSEYPTSIEISHPAYYCFDANDEICQLVVEFIDVDILASQRAEQRRLAQMRSSES